MLRDPGGRFVGRRGYPIGLVKDPVEERTFDGAGGTCCC